MRKITTTAELRGALTSVLRYAKSNRPSRYVLAHELAEIATRMNQDAVSALAVFKRFAKVFTSPEAMQEYLKAHPKANPAKHSVKQKDPGASKKPRTKPEGEAKKPDDKLDEESDKGLEALRSKWKDKKKPAPKPEEKPEKSKASKALADVTAEHDKLVDTIKNTEKEHSKIRAKSNDYIEGILKKYKWKSQYEVESSKLDAKDKAALRKIDDELAPVDEKLKELMSAETKLKKQKEDAEKAAKEG